MEFGLNDLRYVITPEQYLEELYSHTKNGVLVLSRQKPDENLPRRCRYQMRWDRNELAPFLNEFHNLITALANAAQKTDTGAVAAAAAALIPEAGEAQECAIRVARLIRLELPNESVWREECKLMEALVLHRFSAVSDIPNAEGTTFVFLGFDDYQDGHGESWMMAKLQTTGPLSVPVNVHIEDCHRNLQPGDLCSFLPEGWDGKVKVYTSEETLHADGCSLPVPFLAMESSLRAMKSRKTAANEEPIILFTGTVLEADFEPDEGQWKSNCNLLVQTSEMFFRLHLRRKRPIKVGSVLRGTAWLCGTVTKA